jgi:hypothetical protein
MTITPAYSATNPYTFFNSGLLTFPRASVATRVNAAGLIETVPADMARLNHDLVTLAQKGLLRKESRTNLTTNIIGRARSKVFFSSSTNFPLFVNNVGVFLMIADVTNGPKYITQLITSATTTMTRSVYLRRGTNNFAQFASFGDATILVNLNLLTG